MHSSITLKHQPWESSLNLLPSPTAAILPSLLLIIFFPLDRQGNLCGPTHYFLSQLSFHLHPCLPHPYPLYPQSLRTWLWGNHSRGPHCQVGYLIQPSPLHTRLQSVDHVLISDAASGLLPWVSHSHFRSPLRGSNHFRGEVKLVATHNQCQAVVLLYHDLVLLSITTRY